MSKQREALQIALEAMEDHAKQYPHMQKGYTLDAIEALREALAEPSRKPLTDEQLRKLARDAGIKLMNDEALALGYLPAAIKKFARAIERAHGITE